MFLFLFLIYIYKIYNIYIIFKKFALWDSSQKNHELYILDFIQESPIEKIQGLLVKVHLFRI